MEGFQITFFTLRDRHHRGRPMHKWLIETAETLGIHGSTVVRAAEGYDPKGRRHSIHFVELTDQPLEIKIAMREGGTGRLFDLLEQENVNLFYVKTQVEFGTVGAAQVVAPARSRGGTADGSSAEPGHHR